ncbi:hypothetical protein FE257_003278 [Aspergillus nanangensis]|uniref:magnesium chelatase n=1 Tax=Aspergillus nanangensis TaxID=2582783 RepID=A0AAD4CU75_ASPNN|nr:hypothetical protein FE257_003278 [Aspergillus nanangensis]
MEDTDDISSVAVELSDLEVALFLCLASGEHCRIDTTDDNVNDVAKELALISSNTFGLSYTILDCSTVTSLDDFCRELAPLDVRRSATTRKATEQMYNVVIVKNFDVADENIQLHALELMRSRQLTTQETTLKAPADFLFLPLTVRRPENIDSKLNSHLNDHLLISHFHDVDDDYVYLEENNDWLSDQVSVSSVVRKSDVSVKKGHPVIDRKLLDKLRRASELVTVNADVVRYQQDIVVFLRLSRAVSGGITTRSNVHFKIFSKYLAALHGVDYLTPSIVTLAAKKVFRHRIIVSKPEDDRSLQYGSDFKAVSRVLAYATPETILDSVLTLEAPV